MISRSDFELLERCLDGTIDDTDAERLRSLLRKSAEARATLRSLATVDFGLQNISANDKAPDMAEDEDLRSRPGHKTGTSILRAGRPWAVAATVALVIGLYALRLRGEPKVAKITGMGGSVLWTGNGGRVTVDLSVGELLTGGTIEATSPDSWVQLKFVDGSTVGISGNSMLTFSDYGQKELYLRKGDFSGDVTTQTPGKPMLVSTRSARLEVLGTRFKVETELASTVLNVKEGRVRLKRLSDGRSIDVPANHRLVATAEGEMAAESIPGSVDRWKSQLDIGPEGTMGIWSRATEGNVASLRAIPYVHTTPQGQAMTVFTAALPVSMGSGPPVVLLSDARIKVRGRMARDRPIAFGVTVRHPDGGFGGNFLTYRPGATPDGGGEFDIVLDIREFRLDPNFASRKNELAKAPVDVVVESFWCATQEPAGLEIVDVEMSSPASVGP